MGKLLQWSLIAVGGFFVLLALIGIVSAVLGPSVPSNTILRVRLDGPLPETPSTDLRSIFGDHEPLTLHVLRRAIEHAANDDDVVGLVLDIRNPHVGLAQIQELEEAMTKFRKSGKRNVAFLETAGELSSGNRAYGLAVMADMVTLAPPGEINLVGLRAEVPFVKGALDKLDVEIHVEQRHAYKNFANTFTQKSFTPQHREAIKGVVDNLHDDLVAHIAARRNVDSDKVRRWLDTGPHSADHSLSAGMIDRLAYWDEVYADIKEKSGNEEPLMAIAAYAALTSESRSGPKLGVIYGDGEIHLGSSDSHFFVDSSMGSETIAAAFRRARKDEVEGILFRVNSPGGSYIASDLIRREVEVTRQAGIPVVVSMGNVAASGGYFVSMGANRIVAQPATITGSIGVFAGSLALRRFYENLGISWDVYESAPSAGIFSSLDLPNRRHKIQLASLLDRIYADFVTKAAAGRGKTYDELHELARGRIWTGRDALDNGLIDELGGFELALRRLKEIAEIDADAKVELITYPKPKSSFEAVIDALTASTSAGRRAIAVVRSIERAVTSSSESLLHTPFVPTLD